MSELPEISAELRFSKFMKSQNCDDSEIKYAVRDGILHEWLGNYWRPIPVKELEKTAWDWLSKKLPDEATPRKSLSCAQAALFEVNKLPEYSADSLVTLPLKNCTLEIINKGGDVEIRPRKPNRADGLTYMLNCDFDSQAVAPEFDKFLSEVLPDMEVREYVQEYLGYTLFPDSRFQRAQFWLGGGANGKSTLAEIVGALHANVAAIQLDQLDGFNLSTIVGASLVFVDETPARINIQKLKSLISGGPQQIDRKYREPLTIRPTAKWIVCGNSLPLIADHSEGFWRRFPIIPFITHFPDSKQDPLLAKRIIGNELSGILNWALRGLVRLLVRGRFGSLPLAVAIAIDQGKQETNSVLAWWYSNDNHEVHPSASNEKEAVYTDYRDWSHKNGMSPVGSSNFWKRLKSIVGVDILEWRSSHDKRPRMVNIYLN